MEDGVRVIDFIKNPFRFFIRNSRLRLRIILGFVLVGLLVFFLVRTGRQVLFERTPPAVGLVAVKCFKCGFDEDRLVTDIRTAKCSRCGGPVGLHMKCLVCEYEFAFLRPELDPKNVAGKSKFERLQLYLDQQMCPNCSSTKVRTIPFTKEE